MSQIVKLFRVTLKVVLELIEKSKDATNFENLEKFIKQFDQKKIIKLIKKKSKLKYLGNEKFSGQ